MRRIRGTANRINVDFRDPDIIISEKKYRANTEARRQQEAKTEKEAAAMLVDLRKRERRMELLTRYIGVTAAVLVGVMVYVLIWAGGMLG